MSPLLQTVAGAASRAYFAKIGGKTPTVEYLVVAGGGRGGGFEDNTRGGGGAGGYKTARRWRCRWI
jgi:hypothetical protein